MTALDSATNSPQVFRTSPLIRFTLLGLYGSLTIPLPFLAARTHAPIPIPAFCFFLTAAAVVLYGALNERVIVDDDGIAVVYPQWLRWLRAGWQLNWADIVALKPRSTGQGGIVYYFLNQQRDQAYLLPMRVAGFNKLTQYVNAKTNIDMRDVKPLAQPWMYFLLLGMTVMLYLTDGITLWNITHMPPPMG